MRRCSTIGPSESAGKNVSAPTIRTTPTSSTTNSGVVTGKVPADSGAGLLLRQEAGEGEHRHDHGEAADQRREAEQGVVVVGRAREAGERAAVVRRWSSVKA